MIGQARRMGTVSADLHGRYKDASGSDSRTSACRRAGFLGHARPGRAGSSHGGWSAVDGQGGCIGNLDSKTLQATHWAGDPEKDEGTCGLNSRRPGEWNQRESSLNFISAASGRVRTSQVHPGNRTEGRKQIRAIAEERAAGNTTKAIRSLRAKIWARLITISPPCSTSASSM